MNTTRVQGGPPSPPLLRLLVLEENPCEAKLMVSLIEGAGYDPQFSILDSPESFRERLGAGEYDVILSEFNLGNWTALDALEILKHSGKSIPLIVVTVSRGEEAAVECIKQGAADYVLKEQRARLPAAVQQAMEMKRLREERKQAEERFRGLVESTNAIVWEADTATERVTFVSHQGAEKILGYPADQWLQTPGFWTDHLHPADREEALACEREVMEKGQPRSVEYRMRTADGRVLWFRDSMQAVFGPEGKVERLRGFMVDITESKRADRLLSESQALANAIVDSTSDLIWSVDPEDFSLLRFNRSLRSFFFHRRGLSLKIGMRPEDLSPTQDSAERWRKLYRQALSEGSFTTDYVASTGSLTLQLTLNLLKRDGKVFGISVFGKDITERKRAQEELALLKRSIDIHYDGAYWTDTENRFIYINDAGCKALGYEREELIGKTILEVNPEASPEGLEHVWECLRREGFFSTESTHRRKDGSEFRVDLVVTYVQFGGREFSCGFARDISERKRAEEALRQSEARLKEALLAAKMGVWMWTIASDTLTWDENLDRIVGRDPKLLVPSGQKAPKIFGPESWIRLNEAAENALISGTPFELDLELVRPDGSTKWLIARGEPLRDMSGRITQLRGTVQDITERKQAEGALRESEERYRRLFEVESDAIVVVEVDTIRILDANAAALDLYGYSREEFLCLTAEEVSAEPEQTRAAIAREWKRFEFRWHRKKDGTDFPVEITANNFINQGRMVHVEAIRDITERQRVEENLRLTQFSVEHASDAITWADSHGRIVYANEAACRSLGRSRGELLTLTIPDINQNYTKETWGAHWEELKTRGSMTFESQNVSKVGMVFPVEVTANYMEFGGKEYCFAFVRDITKRKWAEEQLRKLSRAVEQSPATVVITDVQGNIEYVNPKFTQLTGYSFEEALGKNPRILKSGNAPAATYRELWQTVLAGGEWRGEFANKKKNGEVYWESASIVPIRGSGGAITHFLAVKEDITERKRGEMALREAETMLRFFVQHAPAPIAMLDREMRYLVVSRRWLTDFRLGDREIRGLSHYEVFPEISERWKEIHGRCMAGAVENCAEDRFARLDGSVDWVRWEIRPWRRIDNSIGGIIIFTELITERKRVAEALRESEARYRAFIEHSREGVWRMELEQPIPINLPPEEILEKLMQYGHLAECNLAHARNLGFSTTKEIVGKRLRDLIPFADEERVESFRAEARSGWRNRGIEFRSHDKSGNLRHYIRTEIPIIENGMLVRAWGITRDVTELKQAEEERERSLEHLRALAGQLQNSREEERKRVAREIHDQLGQALTAIKIDFSSLLCELPVGANQPTRRTASILKLVDESIQTVRRISTELRPGILDDLGLVAALEWAGEDFQARTGTTCRLDLPQGNIAVSPEQATAIFRIFQETLTNVARHADAAGVEVRLSKEDSDLTLEVHDNGKGIPEDRLSNGESLGILGMRERALLLGGEVTISGTGGNGTTVRVRIPVASSELGGISRQLHLFSSGERHGGD